MGVCLIVNPPAHDIQHTQDLVREVHEETSTQASSKDSKVFFVRGRFASVCFQSLNLYDLRLGLGCSGTVEGHRLSNRAGAPMEDWQQQLTKQNGRQCNSFEDMGR